MWVYHKHWAPRILAFFTEEEAGGGQEIETGSYQDFGKKMVYFTLSLRSAFQHKLSESYQDKDGSEVLLHGSVAWCQTKTGLTIADGLSYVYGRRLVKADMDARGHIKFGDFVEEPSFAPAVWKKDPRMVEAERPERGDEDGDPPNATDERFEIRDEIDAKRMWGALCFGSRQRKLEDALCKGDDLLRDRMRDATGPLTLASSNDPLVVEKAARGCDWIFGPMAKRIDIFDKREALWSKSGVADPGSGLRALEQSLREAFVTLAAGVKRHGSSHSNQLAIRVDRSNLFTSPRDNPGDSRDVVVFQVDKKLRVSWRDISTRFEETRIGMA
jgi:hypothetical protein